MKAEMTGEGTGPTTEREIPVFGILETGCLWLLPLPSPAKAGETPLLPAVIIIFSWRNTAGEAVPEQPRSRWRNAQTWL